VQADDLLQPADPLPDAHLGPHRFMPRFTGSSPAAICAHGARPFFPISAVFPTSAEGKSARRTAAQARLSFHFFWRSEKVLDALDAGRWSWCGRGPGDVRPRTQAVDCRTGASALWRSPRPWRSEPEIMLLDEPMAGLGQEDISASPS